MTTTLRKSPVASTSRQNASLAKKEFIEVEKNVKLHVTHLGEGKPVVLIHGWSLNNAMFE